MFFHTHSNSSNLLDKLCSSDEGRNYRTSPTKAGVPPFHFRATFVYKSLFGAAISE